MGRTMGGGGFSGGSRGGGGGSRGYGGRHGGARGGSPSMGHRGYFRLRRLHRHGPRGYVTVNGQSPLRSGCMGTLATFLAILIIALLFGVFFIVSPIFNGSIFEDKIVYDEEKFQNYAEKKYEEIFVDMPQFENNILIVFTVYDGYDGYDCIAYGGDNLNKIIASYFDNNFKADVKSAVSKHYEKTLGKNLTQVIDKITNSTLQLTDEDFYTDTSCSRVFNYSAFSFDESIVNEALIKFTQKTGIKCAIVIDEGLDVFGIDRGVHPLVFAMLIIVIVLIIIITVMIFKRINKKQRETVETVTDVNAGQGTYDKNSGTWT